MRSCMTAGLLGAMVAFASPTAAAQDQPARPSQPAATPKIVFEAEEIHLGKLLDTEKGQGEFKLRNEGNAPLVINRLSSSCGCTEPKIGGVTVTGGKSPEPIHVEIAPGESTTIEVSYNPLGKQDIDTQKVEIETNDPLRPRITLNVLAQVEPLVRVDPRVLAMGDMSRGEPIRYVFKVSGSTSDFRATRVTVNGIPGLRARVAGSKEIERIGGTTSQYEIEITGDGAMKPGDFQGTALVRTNDSRRPFVSVHIMGRILGDLAMSEPRLAFGNLKPGEAVEKTFRIQSKLGKPFEILDVTQQDGDSHRLEFSFKPADGTNTVYEVTARLRAPERAAGVRGSIIIKTNYPDEEEQTLTFTALVTE